MVRDCGIVPLSICSKTSPSTSTHSWLVIDAILVNALPLVDPLTKSPPFCAAISTMASRIGSMLSKKSWKVAPFKKRAFQSMSFID